MDLEESTERIMQRVQQRKLELRDSEDAKENVSSGMGDSICNSSISSGQLKDSPALTKQSNEDDQKPTEFAVKDTNIDADLPLPPQDKSSTTPSVKRRSVFAAMAQDYNDFEVDNSTPKEKPKEAYMKGRSPRLSIGETRPSVLCTPGGISQMKSPSKSNGNTPNKEQVSPQKLIGAQVQKMPILEEEQRRIRFAHPIAATSNYDEYDSSISMYSSSRVTDSERATNESISEVSSRGPISGQRLRDIVSTEENNEGNLSSDEYGAHTFLKKKDKTPTKNDSSSSLKICSPKPFVRGGSSTHFSPIHFNPTSTSSPKVVETSTTTVSYHKSMLTEISLGDHKLQSVSTRKDFVDDLESHANAATVTPSQTQSNTPVMEWNPISKTSSGIDNKKEMSPVRCAAMESAKARTIAQQLEQKLKDTNTAVPAPKSLISAAPKTSQMSVTPTQPAGGMRTQWRGAQGTPVVTGSASSEKTQPDVRASTVKNLKNRWEFSSITGTPLHPDETEDALVKAAIRMKETALPRKEFAPPVSNSTTPKNARKAYGNNMRTDLSSPAAKSPRYEGFDDRHETPILSPAVSSSKNRTPVKIEVPERAELEDTFADNEESDDGMRDNEGENMSRFIDDAFDFMGKSPSKSLPITPKTPATGDRKQAPLATVEATPDFLRSEHRPSYEQHVVEEQEVEEEMEPTRNHHFLTQNDEYNAPRLSKQEENREDAGGSKGQMPYSISFYRKQARRGQTNEPGCQKIDLNVSTPAGPSQRVIGNNKGREELDEELEAHKARLDVEIKVQQSRIAQASRALQLCKNQENFRGGREEVDAQRHLLLATQTRLATIHELERLRSEGRRDEDGPRGSLTISSVIIPLNRDFVNNSTMYHSRPNETIFYFIALLRCGEHVHATPLMTSDDARKRGAIEFAHYFNLKNLSPDFVCSLEIYALRTQREVISHEEKYRLKGGTTKSRTLSRQAGHQLSSSSGGGPSAVADSSFQLVGKLSMDIATQGGKKTFGLQNCMHPLEGTAVVKMKKHSQDRSCTHYRGFLSMYQRTKDGLGSWNRYWCVLDGGEMKFWHGPDDENNENKSWLVLLDLQTCAGDGASTVREICPYPNSFHIDVWVPKEDGTQRSGSGRPELEKLRVMLAADTKPDMNVWLEEINSSVRHLLMWNKPV